MFKLDRKSLLSLSLVATAAIAFTACNSDAEPTGSMTVNGKATIDGAATYPVVNGKTSDYYVNESAHKPGKNYGRIPTANELKAWNTDVTPSKLPPMGSGSVEDGEELYEAQCLSCHGDFGSGGGGYPALSKGNAVDLQKTLTNNRWKDPEADGPTRVFGSYWPVASTLWWYIRDGMPHPLTKSLSVDETYALTAYVLNINEFVIDGVEVDDEYVLDQEKFSKIVMPNVDGFEPNIKGPNALEDVRAYYANAKNFGGLNLNQGAERCMTNCIDKDATQEAASASVVGEVPRVRRIIGVGISDFLPPMSTVRDLPAEDVAFDAKAAYENVCAMCHSSFLAPGSSDWDAYTGKGMDKVYENGINGTEGGMPPMGTSSFSKAEFKSVVDYLVNGK
jgi:cytochrome c